jgi:hypothetical protein
MSKKIFKVSKEVFDRLDKSSCPFGDTVACEKCPLQINTYDHYHGTSGDCAFDKMNIVPFLEIEE